MLRTELIALLIDKHPQFPASDTRLLVSTLIDEIVNHLGQCGRVEIRGFGGFSIRTRPPRSGRNPKTGEKIHVPEKNVLNFRPGKELREMVYGGQDK